MKCPNCNKVSGCGCKSCKSRVKFPMERSEKITGHHIGIIQCPYCRSRYSEQQLLDMEYLRRNGALEIGDKIQWTVDNNDHAIFKNQIFEAEIAMVDYENKLYGVYASYGQDYIPFGQEKQIYRFTKDIEVNL